MRLGGCVRLTIGLSRMSVPDVPGSQPPSRPGSAHYKMLNATQAHAIVSLLLQLIPRRDSALERVGLVILHSLLRTHHATDSLSPFRSPTVYTLFVQSSRLACAPRRFVFKPSNDTDHEKPVLHDLWRRRRAAPSSSPDFRHRSSRDRGNLADQPLTPA